MRDYFLEFEGDLYDARKPDRSNKPIRKGYAKIQQNVINNSIALRAAIRTKYAWPGGYELLGICDDGAVLCCDCMHKEYYQIAYSRRHKINDGWNVVAVDYAANYDSYIYCEHCNKTIVEDWQEEETEND